MYFYEKHIDNLLKISFEGSKKKLNDKINLTAVNYILIASKKKKRSKH